MANKACKKGFILTMNEEGDYLPFFLKVRDKDIIWDPSNLPSNLRTAAEAGDETIMSYPLTKWVYKTDTWNVSLFSDGTYEATSVLAIADFTFPSSTSGSSSEDKVQNKITKEITLPFTTDIESLNGFFVGLTIQSDNDIISASTVGYRPFANASSSSIYGETTYYGNKLTVYLYNGVTPFNDVNKWSTSFNNDKIKVFVRGRIH